MDAAGNVVPDEDLLLKAEVCGPAELLGFGSANPITDENYTKGCFTSYHGAALAVLRAGTQAGEVRLTVKSEALGEASVVIPVC